jgi:hypothetical protein
MQNKGRIVASDISEKSLKELQKRALRAKISIIETTLNIPNEKFDAVVIDAPCSGTGTYRRAPDNVHKLTLEQFNKIKSGNNDFYYYDCLSNMYIYDSIEKPQTTYYKNSTKLSILNKNLYDYEVKSGFNSFYDKTTFNIYYNKYETNSVSFCINKENLDEYNPAYLGYDV